MRILKIEFENLNSLRGKWKIDFTHPDYKKNHDIFVISGPTGAGKTTILDAITLALYGRTPRIEKINAGEGGNEIMTRGTGFCRSQVTYKCKNGVFTSEFTQHRAGNKASGRVQNANFQIMDENGTAILQGTASKLADETKNLIQLDYTQFCRSIMLAQGDFSAFLKSGERERSEILEKLTGMEKYRNVGKMLCEKFSDIKKSYDLLNEKKKNYEDEILSDEELKAAKENESALKKEIETLNKALLKIKTDLGFYEEKKKFEAKLEEAKLEYEKILMETESFKVQKAKLEKAEAALSSEVPYSNFEKLKSEQKKDEAEAENLSVQLEKNTSELSELEKNVGEKKTELSSLEKESEKNQETRNKVRVLDGKIKNLEENLDSAKERLLAKQSEKDELLKDLRDLQEKIDAFTSSLNEAEKFLFENARFSSLDKSLPKLEVWFSQKNEKSKKIAEVEKELEENSRNCDTLKEKLSALETELQNIEKQIQSFISEKALVVSSFLAKSLRDGDSCPVCGGIFRGAKSCGAEAKTVATSGDQPDSRDTEVVNKAADLNKTYEDLKNQVQETKSSLSQMEAKALDIRKNLDELRVSEAELSKLIEEIVSPLETGSEKFTDISVLRSKSELYKKTESERDGLKNKIDAETARKDEKSKTLEGFEKPITDALSEVEEIKASLQIEKEERFKVFADKNVDDEEHLEKSRLEKLKKDVEELEEKFDAARETNVQLSSLKERCLKNMTDRQNQIENAEKAFVSSIKESGFLNEEDFLNARLEKNEIDALKAKSKELDGKKLGAKAKYESAEKTLSDYAASKKITATEEELEVQKRQTEEKFEEEQGRLNDVSARLLNAKNKKDEYEAFLSNFEEKKKEFERWKTVKSWVGNADGRDLSVFVQSIAFSKLLNLTNKHLFGITNRYKIVQKNPNTLDFEINDVHLENRSTNNLSGGEQFIVSLSLALGISEFASRNVRVDSLFLDEGFGTLSGELLIQAINALKALQKNGKMLGIITHVKDVINEIDQRLEVKPVSGGYSEIIGSGVTRG